MASHNLLPASLCVGAGVCVVSAVCQVLAARMAGAVSTCLTVIAYTLYVPGGLVANLILPAAHLGRLWPVGLLIDGVLYALLAYAVGRQMRRT